MAKPIGFSAFLKLLQLADVPRKTELRRKLGGGKGFQYWKPFQLAAPKAIFPGADLAALAQDLEYQCSEHQLKYNKGAFKAFLKWVEGKDIEAVGALPPKQVALGDSGLTVKLHPELCVRLEGTEYSL